MRLKPFIGLLAVNLVAGACTMRPAAVPDRLLRETFSHVQWTNRDYRTERGRVAVRDPLVRAGFLLAVGEQFYEIEGDYTGSEGAVRFRCRNRASEVPAVRDVLPNASFGCHGSGDSGPFVLAFDDRCAAGVLITGSSTYRLERWRHEVYDYQEGFWVYDGTDVIRGALSWSSGPRVFDGVWVDPSLADGERTAMALSRAALLGMRIGEEEWPLCGTVESQSERLPRATRDR